MEQIVQRALRLKELEKLIVKSIIEWEPEQIEDFSNEFSETRKQIRLTLIENPIISNIHNKHAVEIIKIISADEKFPIEKALENGSFEDLLKDELSGEELEEIGNELFHSWFSHLDYADGRFKFGSLILQLGKIPEHLEPFVVEVRESYIFQNYLAVICLCRTIIEISAKDICKRKRIIPRTKGNIAPLNTLTLKQMIDKVSQGQLKSKFHDIRKEANLILHGTVAGKHYGSKAKDILENTLTAVQDLYSYHGFN